MQPYEFSHKRDESYDLAALVQRWFERRGDVIAVHDVQDDPEYYYRGDLTITRSGGRVQYIEIKTETSYTRHTTDNLAIERYSDIAKQTSGGPWSTTADFYAHVYADGLLVIMNRARLVAWLDRELAADPRTFAFREIPNAGWVTGTYLVPRARAKAALGIWYREHNIL